MGYPGLRHFTEVGSNLPPSGSMIEFGLKRLESRTLNGRSYMRMIVRSMGTKYRNRGELREHESSLGWIVGLESHNAAFLILLHVCIPFIGGLLIYTLSKNPLMISVYCIDSYLLHSILDASNNLFIRYCPTWTYYNVPDALWVYSLCWLIAIVWDKGPTIAQIGWITGVLLIAFGIETAQGIRLIPGTFDTLDLLWSIGAWFTALFEITLARGP